jgi:hypothetical protein
MAKFTQNDHISTWHSDCITIETHGSGIGQEDQKKAALLKKSHCCKEAT